MTFTPTELEGAYIVTPRVFPDARGTFRMTYVREEFLAQGIAADYVQTNISTSKPRHTLRGMHFQTGAAAQDKLVRCIRGILLDVIIDIRPDSPTYCKHISVTLDAEKDEMLFVPKGFAHGFITLVEDTHLMYQVSYPYTPSAESGIRWNDPAFGIEWPSDYPLLSEKDSKYPDYDI
ncbi:MAG: dTDP-4-dehydrorhamnose 3,5-epimerase [Spirochaetes bacterium]|nr:dTDP-4-dehydrorhamnose 3,5-epimerase [Spirochaetota bacterium]